MPKILDLMYGSMEAGYHRELDNNIWRDWTEFTRKYIVLGDNLNQDENAVLNITPSLPRLGTPLYNCICDSVKAKETDRVVHPSTHIPCGLWEIEAHFTNNFKGDKDQEEDDPTKYVPIWTVDGDSEEEIMRKDKDDKLVINSVGDPLFVSQKVTIGVLKIVRYEYYPYDLRLLFEYGNTVNSVPFWGAPKGTCLMLPMTVENEWIEVKNPNGTKTRRQFSRVTYQIQVKAKGTKKNTWQLSLLNEGYRCREKPGGPIVTAKDKNGHGSGGMVNLKLDGTQAISLEEYPTDPDGVVYLAFNAYEEKDFNLLNLGPYQ